MQTIEINDITLIPPAGQMLDIPKVIEDTEKVFESLKIEADGDIDICFPPEGISICCVCLNAEAKIMPEKAWEGDPDCIYGQEEMIELNPADFLDEADLKAGFEKVFTGWDVEMEDVRIQTPEEVFEEEYTEV